MQNMALDSDQFEEQGRNHHHPKAGSKFSIFILFTAKRQIPIAGMIKPPVAIISFKASDLSRNDRRLPITTPSELPTMTVAVFTKVPFIRKSYPTKD
jgi:hypothetical protein